jgi:hypothetical protein
MADGKSDAAIPDALFISESVETHQLDHDETDLNPDDFGLNRGVAAVLAFFTATNQPGTRIGTTEGSKET